MSSSLIPERPLLLYPSLAATLGLEEATCLSGLADLSAQLKPAESRGYLWYQLSTAQLLKTFPFWDLRDIQRVLTNLREKGVLIIASAHLEHAETLKFAFNEKLNQQLGRQIEPAAPANASLPSRTSQSPTPSESGHFLSKNTIGDRWQPDQATLGQLAQHGITEQFAREQVPEFVTYWRERGERQFSWGSKFMQHTLRRWREFEAAQYRKDQESRMSSSWQPSADAMDILVRQAGISQGFVEDSVPEFILYWSERGDALRTWNSKFVQHVRIQWAKFTAAIENTTDPQPIPSNWQPSADVYDVLRLANIDLAFAQALIPEFLIYWQDRGVLYSSWNTKFLQHAKRMWAQRHASSGDLASNRNIKDLSLEEELTDRSWAN